MNRRDFIAASAAGAAGVLTAKTIGRTQSSSTTAAEPFTLEYAPHLGMFRHHAGDDPLDQLRFMADAGFRAFEDNGMAGRDVETQQKMAAEMEKRDIRMGVFVANPSTAWKPTFTKGDKDACAAFLNECRTAVEVAKRVNATWMTVVPGTRDSRLELDFQTAHAVEQLRMAADIFEPHDLVMVLEPLNPFRDHPGMFLARTAHAHQICRAVNSPACKILYDIYHQQITEGNLIPNIDAAWDEIAYFQIGDNPGRAEPTTGEINYKNIFAHIYSRGFTGILGMEHGNSRPSKAGEQHIIDAYRSCDPSS